MKESMFKHPRTTKLLLNALVWAGAIIAVSWLISDSEHREWLFLSMIVGWFVSDKVTRRRIKNPATAKCCG